MLFASGAHIWCPIDRDAAAKRLKFRTWVLPFLFGPLVLPVLQKGWALPQPGVCFVGGGTPSPWTGRRIQVVSESSCARERAAGLKPGAYIGLRWINWLVDECVGIAWE